MTCSFSQWTFSRLSSWTHFSMRSNTPWLPHSICVSISASLYFNVSAPSMALQCACQHLDLEHVSCYRSVAWEHQLTLARLHHSLFSCCLLMRSLILVVHSLQEMQQREQTLCNCRQMVSLFSPEGVLPISPNSTLFLAFFYSQLLLTSNPLPSFSLFFSFRKIITWVQRDTHCVCVFVSVYIRELPFLCFDFHIKPGFHHSCWFQL